MDRGNTPSAPLLTASTDGDSAAAIIDYASPASNTSLRLPARSEIRWHSTPTELRITQVLSGRGEAVGALALAAFTVVLMSFLIHPMLPRWNRYAGEILVLATFISAEVVLGALVINNTWRKTVLTVTPQQMMLRLTSPLGSGQRFEFPSEQIAAVNVVDRAPLPGEAVVAELEIRMWSIPSVRLFAGHPHRTLIEIVRAIGRVQPLAPPPLPTAPPSESSQARDGLISAHEKGREVSQEGGDLQRGDSRPGS